MGLGWSPLPQRTSAKLKMKFFLKIAF